MRQTTREYLGMLRASLQANRRAERGSPRATRRFYRAFRGVLVGLGHRAELLRQYLNQVEAHWRRESALYPSRRQRLASLKAIFTCIGDDASAKVRRIDADDLSPASELRGMKASFECSKLVMKHNRGG